MIRMKRVCQFVRDYIVYETRACTHQIHVEKNPTSWRKASPTLRHSANNERRTVEASSVKGRKHQVKPFTKHALRHISLKRRQEIAAPRMIIRVRGNDIQTPTLDIDTRSRTFMEREAVLPPKEEMALAGDKVTCRGPDRLISYSINLPEDPVAFPICTFFDLFQLRHGRGENDNLTRRLNVYAENFTPGATKISDCGSLSEFDPQTLLLHWPP
jgi:hypothetical protein